MGKVWESGAVQVVQCADSLSDDAHPRNRLPGWWLRGWSCLETAGGSLVWCLLHRMCKKLQLFSSSQRLLAAGVRGCSLLLIHPRFLATIASPSCALGSPLCCRRADRAHR